MKESITLQIRFTDIDSSAQFADSDVSDPQLVLWIIATHSDIPINYRLYKRSEMEKAVHTFVTPFKKPVLVHHDTHDDQIGRVVEQHYIPAESWDNVRTITNGFYQPLPQGATGQIVLKQVVTDSDAVNKVLDGIYNTVSVGFDASDLLCSICGNSMLLPESDGGCQHTHGMEYDGEIQYGIPIDIVYREVSFVNVPADSYAQLLGIRKIEKSEARKMIGFVHDTYDSEQDNNGSVNSTDDVEAYSCASSGYGNTEVLVSFNDVSENKERAKEVLSMEVDVARLKELELMNDHLSKKLADMEDRYNRLNSEYETLKTEYSKLKDALHSELTERVANLKAILFGIESDEEVAKIKEEYKDYPVETLRVIEKEFIVLVDKLFESEEQKEVEEQTEEKVVEKVEEQKVEEQKDGTAEEKKEDKIVKDSSPVKMTDSVDLLSILGIRK